MSTTISPPSGVIDVTEVDNNWSVRGRVVPPSCSNGEGTILCLQARHIKWETTHFHYAATRIPPELGIEVISAILVPFNEELITTSLDPEEEVSGVEYIHMTKVINPADSVAFITSNGIVATILLTGMGDVFSVVPKYCKRCYGLVDTTKLPDEAALDRILNNVQDKDGGH